MMSSVIFKTQVLDYGDIQDEGDFWVGKSYTRKSSFPGAEVIDATPPYDSTWLYVDGEFCDIIKLQEEEREQAEKGLEQSEQAGYDAQSGLVRKERNFRLYESDWTQGKDIDDSVSIPWAAYRQELRDVTKQSGFPWNVVWPEEPKID